jgi:hypothetical protein
MLYLFSAVMILIASTAFTDRQYFIGAMAMVLSMGGIFIYKNYDHPAVLEWVKRWF